MSATTANTDQCLGCKTHYRGSGTKWTWFSFSVIKRIGPFCEACVRKGLKVQVNA